MSKDNEPRQDCAHYQWGDGDYPRELGARCGLYGGFFSLGADGLHPRCAGCAGFLEREDRGGQGGSVMMLQSKLAKAEQRAERAKASCFGCPLWSGTDCMMPTPEFGCVRDLQARAELAEAEVAEVARLGQTLAEVAICEERGKALAQVKAEKIRIAAKQSLTVEAICARAERLAAARLCEALRFYAARASYQRTYAPDPQDGPADTPPVLLDGGRKARKALGWED